MKKRITKNTKDKLCDILHYPYTLEHNDDDNKKKYTEINKVYLELYSDLQLEKLLNDKKPYIRLSPEQYTAVSVYYQVPKCERWRFFYPPSKFTQLKKDITNFDAIPIYGPIQPNLQQQAEIIDINIRKIITKLNDHRQKWFEWNIKNELESRIDYQREKKLKELFK